MEQVLTLVAPDALDDARITPFARLPGVLSTTRLGTRAADIVFGHVPPKESWQALAVAEELDAACQPLAGRRKRLLIADMDSTIVAQESLDELADLAGFGNEISAITERAMRGELDFEEALRARVSRLEGMSADLIDRVNAERLTLTPGAEVLVRTMRAGGATTLLVSGGFDVFVAGIAERCGFDRWRANRLGRTPDGRLDGTVAEPILGREAKRAALEETCSELGIDLRDALAVGDGANDLAMIDAAGLGVAHHGKPAVAAAADAAITHTDLTALLYFQGYADKDFVT